MITKQKNVFTRQCENCSVRKNALFKGIPMEDLKWTSSLRISENMIKAGDVIFEEGSIAPYAFTLYSGWVKLYKTLKNGKRQILRISLPGDFIGFQEHLTAPMTYSAEAISDVSLCAFSRDKLNELFAKKPEFSGRMLNMAASYMALCQHYMLSVGSKTSKARVAFLLLDVWYRSQIDHTLPQENTIEFPLSQMDIAETIGITQVHANRTLNELKKSGYIDYTKKTLTILEFDKLIEISEYQLV